MVEFALVLLPTMAFLLMIMDVAWIIFGWACIQEGAREGVRFAVANWATNRSETALNSATKPVVQQYSFGFAQPGNITIDYCPATGYSSTGPPACLDGQAGAVAPGNVLKITVSGVAVGSFGAIFRTWSPVTLSATAADILQ